MTIEIENLPTTNNPSVAHLVPAEKDNLTVALTVQQITALKYLTKSSNYTPALEDHDTLIECTAAMTLALPAAGSVIKKGYFLVVKANGGIVTIDPNSSELVDGAATKALADGEMAILTCDGVGWFTSIPAAVKRNDSINTTSSNIASAATTNLANATGVVVNITGTTTITALGTLPSGVERVLIFAGALTLTHNATSLILPGGANILTAAGDVAIARSLGSGNWKIVSYQRASRVPADLTPFGVMKQQLFPSSGTYTPDANMLYCLVECIGAGGGGGGAIASTSGWINGAGGGGGGEYSRSFLTKAQIGASKAVTIGAGGTAGPAGNNFGGAGGTASLGSLVTAVGGNGGGGAAAGGVGAGGNGGTGGTGDFKVGGQKGGAGGVASSLAVNAPIYGGVGGDSIYGFGGPATGYGAGGTGASDSNAGGNKAGSAGAAGVVIVTEYCSQ